VPPALHEGRIRDNRGHGLFDATAWDGVPEERVSRKGRLGLPVQSAEVAAFDAELRRPRARPPSARVPPGGVQTVVLG